jgi:hypothetical protein
MVDSISSTRIRAGYQESYNTREGNEKQHMTKNAAKTTLQNKQKKFKNLKTLFETLTL